MTRPAPRRPSRITTPKPRKIAGRDTAPAEQVTEAPVDAPEDAGTPAGPPEPPRPPKRAKPEDPDGGIPGRRGPSALGSHVTTVVLLVFVGFFVLLLVLQGVWFNLHGNENDDRARAERAAAERADADGDEDGDDENPYEPITVPSGRPVGATQLDVQGGVDAAASSAQVMFARNWETYDDSVDEAVGIMTESFAEEYRATSDDARREFVKRKTDVQVRVVAQGVVRANATELEALLFVNQYTIRGVGDDARTTFTPYRVLMKMVNTDQGWLVDDVDTK